MIFAAVLAIVAIGGAASSVSAIDLYSAGATQPVECNGPGLSCASNVSGKQYRLPGPGDQGTTVPSAEYTSLAFIPE